MEEELAVAIGVVSRAAGLHVLGDRGPDEPGLALTDVRVCLTELDVPVPCGLHLGARQHDSSLDPLEELVVAPRATVLGDELDTGRLGHGGSLGTAS